jgi:hypothetical protein
MLDKYPLLVKACALMFNGSFCNMHQADQSHEVIAAHVTKLVPLPAAAFQAAEVALLAEPQLMLEYEVYGQCSSPVVELVVGAYAKAIGLE